MIHAGGHREGQDGPGYLFAVLTVLGGIGLFLLVWRVMHHLATPQPVGISEGESPLVS